MKPTILSVEITINGEDEHSSVNCHGSISQVLGMVARSRVILDKIERGIMSDMLKEKEKEHATR